MGVGWGEWARGFPTTVATTGSHSSRDGTDVRSWCVGDALWLHLLASPASLHVSGSQDMVPEPCMLHLPHRHPRVTLALLHVLCTGDRSHACWIHPGQPQHGSHVPRSSSRTWWLLSLGCRRCRTAAASSCRAELTQDLLPHRD